ncbi:hypothetical protein [Planctomycetes bacterium Pla163]
MTDEVLAAGFAHFKVEHGAPWGDYGAVLMNGCMISGPDGVERYGRVGPFVPPVSTCWGVGPLVTDKVADRLRASGLRGLELRRVEPRPAVRFDWRHLVDRAPELDDPIPDEIYERLIESDPNSLVSHGQHDSSLVDEMGPLWQIHGTEVPMVHGADGDDAWDRAHVGELDAFHDGDGWRAFSLRALEVLVQEAGAPCRFQLRRVVDVSG